MKISVLILAAAVGLTTTAIRSQAQTEPVVAHPATQTTTYQQHSDANGNISSSETTIYHPEVKATPVPTPVPVVMNHAAHTAPAVVMQVTAPVTEPAQQRAPVAVYDGKLILPAATPNGQKVLSQEETAAEYKKNVKSGKWKEFKNGE